MIEINLSIVKLCEVLYSYKLNHKEKKFQQFPTLTWQLFNKPKVF